MNNNKKKLHVQFYGRVQGVGFRHYAKTIAESMGIDGEVKNLPDGSVEVIAEGDEAMLKSYMAKFRDGPSMSRVDKLEDRWSECKNEYSGFEISG